MKRFMALFTALIMVFIFTACIDENMDDSGGDAAGVATAELISWMNSGTFSFDYTMSEDDFFIEGTLSADGNRFAMIMNVEEYGEIATIRIVVTENYAYMIFEDEEMYMEIPMDEVSEAVGDLMEAFNDMGDPIESGEGEVNGKSLPFEKYSSVGGSISTFYFEDGQVYAIEVYIDGETAIMIVTNASKTVSESIFAPPPDDYMSFDEMLSAMWADF